MAASPSLSETLKRLPGDLLKFPSEIVLSVIYYILFVIMLSSHSSAHTDNLENTLLMFFPLYVLTFTLNRTGWRIPYILSPLLLVPFLFFEKIAFFYLPVAYILAVILLVAGKGKMDNVSYAKNVLHVSRGFGRACIIGLILEALIGAIVFSVQALFAEGGYNVFYENAFFYLSGVVGFIVVPLLSCVFVGAREPRGKASGFTHIVLNYLLSPALCIYTVILYAYVLRILLRWELPEGGVAYMVSAYLGVALVCYLMGHSLERRPFAWFYKWFPILAVPLIVLLWVGSMYRICEYGFTQDRFYLLLSVVLLTVFVALAFFERTRDFQKMTFAAGVALAFFTFIPGISADDFGIYSQQKRLESVLPSVTEDGKFNVRSYTTIALDPVMEMNYRDAYHSYNYLKDHMDGEKFDKLYGPLGSFAFSEYDLHSAKEKLEGKVEGQEK